MLEKLERCRRAHGDSQVRIGVRGRPECPNYLIEYAVEDPKSHKISVFAEMNVTAVSALIGRLRKPRDPSRRTFED